MNQKLIGIKDTSGIAEDTVLLFESDIGWNAVGGIEILAKRHFRGLNVALADGSVLEIQPDEIPNLRWNPTPILLQNRLPFSPAPNFFHQYLRQRNVFNLERKRFQTIQVWRVE